MSWTTAKRDGKCPNCKGQISKDAQIYNRRGVWLCEECGLVAENTPDQVMVGGVLEAVLKDLSFFPQEAQDSALARAMIHMARQLDNGDVGPRDTTNYTKELRLNLMQLHDMYPPETPDDATDEAQKKRERRMREQGGI